MMGWHKGEMGMETKFYEEIKSLLISNEVYKRVKDYSKNRNDLETYYNVGKLIVEAQGGEKRAEQGKKLIKKFSKKLIIELNNNKYSERNLRYMRQFYLTSKDDKWNALRSNLSWSHYRVLISLNNFKKIEYYINISIKDRIGYRELEKRVKSNEYERLPGTTKSKLINDKKLELIESVPNPILIPNSINIEKNDIKEKALKQLILENLDNFLHQLGHYYLYAGNEYKIVLNDRFYYIDLLLFNIEFNCYIVIELKIRELKKEDIGQIKFYMNYIDKNIKSEKQDNTIGIILCKKGNDLVLEYTSDERIYSREYRLI